MERTPDDLFKIKNFAILKSPLPRHLFKGAITPSTTVSSPLGGASFTGLAKPVTTHPVTPSAFFVKPRLPPNTVPHITSIISSTSAASLVTASPLISSTECIPSTLDDVKENVYSSEKTNDATLQSSNQDEEIKAKVQETKEDFSPQNTNSVVPVANPDQSNKGLHSLEHELDIMNEDPEVSSTSTYASDQEMEHDQSSEEFEHDEQQPLTFQACINNQPGGTTTDNRKDKVTYKETSEDEPNPENIDQDLKEEALSTHPTMELGRNTESTSSKRTPIPSKQTTTISDDINKHSKPDVVFSEWSFGIAPNTPRVTNVSKEDSQEWIVLVGRRPDTAELWHSSIVTRRLAHNRIETGSGRVYVLHDGSMDSQRMADHGFGDSFSAKFVKGFPSNWQQLLITELTRIATSRAPRKPVTATNIPERKLPTEPQQPHNDEPQTKKPAVARKEPTPKAKVTTPKTTKSPKTPVPKPSTPQSAPPPIIKREDVPVQSPDASQTIPRKRGRPRKNSSTVSPLMRPFVDSEGIAPSKAVLEQNVMAPNLVADPIPTIQGVLEENSTFVKKAAPVVVTEPEKHAGTSASISVVPMIEPSTNSIVSAPKQTPRRTPKGKATAELHVALQDLEPLKTPTKLESPKQITEHTPSILQSTLPKRTKTTTSKRSKSTFTPYHPSSKTPLVISTGRTRSGRRILPPLAFWANQYASPSTQTQQDNDSTTPITQKRKWGAGVLQ